MASGAVPTSQLIGGAVGSAGAGAMAHVLGFGPHGIDAALAYSLVIVAVCLLPETTGRRLDVDSGGAVNVDATGYPTAPLRCACA